MYEPTALIAKSIKNNKHISNRGYEHRFVSTLENQKTPKMTCDICNEVYSHHMDRLITFKTGNYSFQHQFFA